MYFLISVGENEAENGLCRVKLRDGSHPIAFSNLELGEMYLSVMNLKKSNFIKLSNNAPEEWFSKFPDATPEYSRTNVIAFVNSRESLNQLIGSPEEFNSYYGDTI